MASTVDAEISAPKRTKWYRQLYFWVIVAIVLGILVGWLWPNAGKAMEPIGWVCPRSVETSPLRRYGDGRDAAEVRRGLQAWCGGAGLREGEADRAGGPG